jgi:alkylated DNA repair dioxygenase AlkB
VTGDLFPKSEEGERIPIPDAEVYFFQSLKLPEPADILMTKLIAETPWRSDEIVVWGKRHPQPRLIAWYGDAGQSYAYSGIDLKPLPWTNLLLQLKDYVEAAANERFNSVLLNYYRDNLDSMGMHSDDEPELGPRPVIASLSLGEQRTLVFKHKSIPLLRPVRLPLSSGSLLLMRGETQQFWKHGINKETRTLGARVNLTFRQIHGKKS